MAYSEKSGDITIHLKLSERSHDELRAYADLCNRSITQQIAYILDVHMHGAREIRLIQAGKQKK